MLRSNWLAFLLTAAVSVFWLRVIDLLAHKGLIGARLSRKIIHIGTGPIYVLCWLLFPPLPAAKYFAAVIPLLITLQFALIGFGVIKDQASVDAMSRSGDPKEILKGPLYYGIMFVLLTILFWQNPVGIVALMMLCGGDGMADLIGKKYGKNKLPWSHNKSPIGSAAVFFAGVSLSLIVLGIYSFFDASQSLNVYIFPVIVVGFIAAIIESLPFKDIDNITVPIIAVITGMILYG